MSPAPSSPAPPPAPPRCGRTALRSRFYDDDDETSSDETSSDEEPSPQRVGAVRDDYDGDEQYKMLLIFNQELYKLSSKTGELKSVKMSPGKAAAQAATRPLAPTDAACAAARTRCATGCGSAR